MWGMFTDLVECVSTPLAHSQIGPQPSYLWRPINYTLFPKVIYFRPAPPSTPTLCYLHPWPTPPPSDLSSILLSLLLSFFYSSHPSNPVCMCVCYNTWDHKVMWQVALHNRTVASIHVCVCARPKKRKKLNKCMAPCMRLFHGFLESMLLCVHCVFAVLEI